MTSIDTIPGLRAVLDRTQEEIQALIGQPVTVRYTINGHRYSLDELAAIVCETALIKVDDLKGKCQEQTFVIPRQIFCWFSMYWLNNQLVTTGNFINRDHTTVMASKKRVDDMLDTNDNIYCELMERVKARLIKK
jgi:chromosomal replication initiation ATPase DnaA